MKPAAHGAATGLVVLAVAAAACTVDIHDGPLTTRTHSVDLDHAESVSVELKTGAGELSVRGGAAKLMEGTFSFRPKELDPVVSYETVESRGTLRIESPSSGMNVNPKQDWDLRLNNDKPTDIKVNFGAGQGELELGSLNLRSVTVEMGVGQLKLDLRGTPRHDYSVEVRGGVGEATVYVPQGVGIIADMKGGIGNIDADGLEKRDGHYVNSAYGVAPITVRLNIQGGIGSIRLIAD